MKKHKILFLLSIMRISNCMLIDQGPMNAEWFYAQNHPFVLANNLHQDRKWGEAEMEYIQKLSDNAGTEYDKKMAEVNLAACQMAQQKPTEHWGSFDALIGIEESQRLSKEKIDNIDQDSKKSVLVRTDQVGIGDIAHFMETTRELKKRKPNWNVTVSVPPFLKGTLSNVITEYGCEIIGAKDEQPKTDYTTHIIGLLGHLKMNPAETMPDKILLTAPEKAMKAVYEQINPILAQGKTLVVVNAGEDRQATLIGGKKLPANKSDHGRHLSQAVFQSLLKKNPNLVLVDCGTPACKVTVAEDQKDQYMVIPKEEQPFDTHIALANIMGINEKIIAILSDQGPSNVFARALNPAAQKRAAFIIPNPGEYDMRMEGMGPDYKQMISDCLVFKSDSPHPDYQLAVLEKVLQKMKVGK